MTRTAAHAGAARRIWSCVALALCCLCVGGARGVAALSLDNAVAQSLAGLRAGYMAACPYFGCVSASAASSQEEAVQDDIADAFPTEMPLVLPGEDAMRSYPAFPHSPLLVAAGTCQAVVLRWRSFEDLVWPVSRFILQRFPDSQHRPQWGTVLDGNVSDLVDLEVRAGRRYTYRIQALSDRNASSAFAYHWTTVQDARDGSAASCICGGSGALATSLNSDGARSLGLILACFLTVYGLMRASVKGVQGTQSRSSRLKRISKSTSEGASPRLRPSTSGLMEPLPANFAARRSSTSTSISSEQSASVEQSGRSSGGSAVFDANVGSTAATAGHDTRHSMMDSASVRRADSAAAPQTRPASRSIGGVADKAETCNHCHKRFGLFRRRYVCDICHSVTLCRKCGFQASVDSFAAGRGSPDGGARRRGQRRSSVSQQHQKKLKIRTICRACCDDMYRFSTHPSVRPSYVAPGHQSASVTAAL